ncbi:DMT family transporter [Candidatus Woesebacteria bacterium]|nr:DMT family transporter [Candidatus Woesebacteria bacterium]
MRISKGFTFTFISAFAWAVTISLSKFAFQGGENVYTLAFWTTIFAIPFWALLLLNNKKELKTIPKAGVYVLLGMGLNSIILSILESFAIKFSTAINYSFLIRSVLLFTVLFALIFLNETLTRKKIVLVVLTLVGAYLLTTKGQILSLSLGDGLTLLEAAFIAFGNNILGKLSTKNMSANIASAGSFFVSVVPIAIIALINNAVVFPKFPLLLVGITVFSILITTMRFRAYRHASASYVTMIFSFTPVFVALIAYFFLHETITLIQVVGGGMMVLAGIATEKLKI